MTDLPFFGQYYGGVPFGASSAANLKLRAATESGTSFFFVAECTGMINRIHMHWRHYIEYKASYLAEAFQKFGAEV